MKLAYHEMEVKKLTPVGLPKCVVQLRLPCHGLGASHGDCHRARRFRLGEPSAGSAGDERAGDVCEAGPDLRRAAGELSDVLRDSTFHHSDRSWFSSEERYGFATVTT